MSDPFTDANLAIVNALLASDAWRSLVLPLNRLTTVSVDGTVPGEKMIGGRAPIDYPEFLITQRGCTPVPARNSKSFGASQVYTLQIVDSGGQKRKVDRLNLVKWESLKALVSASRLSPPFGLTFLSGWDWESGTEGREPNADNQPAGDWVSIMNIRMNFSWSYDQL